MAESEPIQITERDLEPVPEEKDGGTKPENNNTQHEKQDSLETGEGVMQKAVNFLRRMDEEVAEGFFKLNEKLLKDFEPETRKKMYNSLGTLNQVGAYLTAANIPMSGNPTLKAAEVAVKHFTSRYYRKSAEKIEEIYGTT